MRGTRQYQQTPIWRSDKNVLWCVRYKYLLGSEISRALLEKVESPDAVVLIPNGLVLDTKN